MDVAVEEFRPALEVASFAQIVREANDDLDLKIYTLFAVRYTNPKQTSLVHLDDRGKGSSDVIEDPDASFET